MSSTVCPTSLELAGFALGKITSERCELIASHVEDCPECQAELGTFDTAADTLVASLRRSVDEQSAGAPAGLLAAIESIGRIGDGAADLGRIRDYQLLEKLGEGGMGAVYKALHMHLEKIVALKVLPADRLSPSAVARFRREMKAVGKLDHPHIVRAMDAGEEGGKHFLVMECIEGADLAALVGKHGFLGVADACEIIRQAAVGLQHAHEHQLVHRDIKPSNLMLTTAGQVKILDLGLALLGGPQQAGEELTGASQMMGTADYIAPEQTGDSHGVDIRADIYSLGCTLYKLLSGEAPYVGKEFTTPIQKIMAHVGRPAPAIRDRRPDVPEALAAILARTMAKQQAERFATPAELVASLAPYCVGSDLARLAAVETIPAGGELSTAGDKATDAYLSSPGAGTWPSSLSPVGRVVASIPRRNRAKWAIAVLAVFFVLAAGIVIKVRTNDGTLILTVDNPNAVVKIDGQAVEVTPTADGRTLRIEVEPGKHSLVVTTSDGLRFKTEERFEMESGGNVQLTATLEPLEVPVAVAPAEVPTDEEVIALVEKAGGNVRRDFSIDARPIIEVHLLGSKVKDSELRHFAGLGRLNALILGNTRVGDDGIAHLAGLTNLHRLDLGTTDVTDAGLAHLKGMSTLRRLELYRTKIGDAGLAHLSGLSELKVLGLEGTRVGDAGMAHLSGLTKLEALNLGGTQVSDAGLEHLTGLISLSELHVHGSQATDAGKRRLMETLAAKRAGNP